ncbi:NADH-quinone oxidoreductase subunit N [Streptomyces sp. TRM 70351]|uniref:NADH-quinone oxidoreductase subunit N n=1 Tax=Streptomyces sp. TRM 70351 TaxID=3116552 RepID=UPI002E7BE258|nr:NADH-quinone oxidoreductase subunit N [Streptomyces sp. TRM 70351]MEE1930937.1 NADH-quinone oxidoreductase subunit N [Streptomyces sp. TRM 70351]
MTASATGGAAVTLTAGPVQSVDWAALGPPAIVAALGLVLLVTDLFLPERRKPLLGWAAVAGLGLALLALLPLVGADRSTFCLTTDPELCSYTADGFALAVQLLVLGGTLLTALLSLPTVADSRLPAGEYWFLLLTSAAGAALLPAARDLATLVIALEVASLPVFALIALRRGDRLGSEAALKFFLSSVAATAVTLLGVSFVYAATGGLHFGAVADGLRTVDAELAVLAPAGVVLTLVGFAFKTAAVPYHFWVPETYVGAPVPVAAYLSVTGKAAGFSGLVLVTVYAFPAYATTWGPALAVLAALTMTAGNAGALRQRPEAPHSAVRLLAWSSVAQAGYLLVPIASAAYAADAGRAVGATVTYALMYAVVNLGAFAVVLHLARAAGDGRLTAFRGLYAAQPLAALALAFFLLCLAGLPPGVIGLFAKVTVFAAAVDAGLGWLAAVMAVNVVIGLVYYLRWTALLFRAPATGPEAAPADTAAAAAPAGTAAGTVTGRAPSRLRPATPLGVAIAVTAVLGLVLSGAPQLVLRFASGSLL